MDVEIAANPYMPGSGIMPRSLAGRDDELALFDALPLRAKQGLPSRGIVLTGLRGVGKTVLLESFRLRADDASWLTCSIEGSPGGGERQGVRRRFAADLLSSARKLGRGRTNPLKQALGSIGSFSMTLGLSGISFGFEALKGRADSGTLDFDLQDLVEDLAEPLKKHKIGFAVFVDEMQDLDPEFLGALLAAQHKASQRGWSFYVCGAGLPDLPGRLADVRSYAERLFDYRDVGPLEPMAARRALTEPVELSGVLY
ncbi:MAG: ATP-binding protein, partial [Bifidobacteriaceae bacterium]|nr:ATP-binding protein [Bifidobacteriaceae bacterium]